MAAGGWSGNSRAGYGNLEPLFRLQKSWKGSFFNFFENNFRLTVLLGVKLAFSNYVLMATVDGWELVERAREGRVRKTLLAVGFPEH